MEVISYLLEDAAEMEACLAAIEPEEMECHTLLVEIFGVSLGIPEFCHIAHTVREQFPGTIVAGGACEVVISGGRGNSSGVSLTFIKFDFGEVRHYALPLDEKEHAPEGEACLAWLDGMQDLAAVQIMSVGQISTIGHLFRGRLHVPVFGGLLADSTDADQGYIYCDGDVITHGLMLIAICGRKVSAYVEYSSGWQPLGPRMKVTSLNDPYHIKELDKQPFASVYNHYIGHLEGESFLDKSLLFPLILHKGDYIIARHPLKLGDDGAAAFGASFQQGDDVQFGYGDPSKVIYETQAMQKRIAAFRPQALFLSDCLARWRLLDGNMEAELKNCRHIAPSFGFYGYGELMNGDQNGLELFNMTLVLAGLKEEGTERVSDFDFTPDKIALTRGQQFITHLVHFVETTTAELETLNVLLGKKAQTDALTGLFNKGQIEDVLAEALHQEVKHPRGLCLVMIDLDNFKNINDTFGHGEGDVALKALSQAIRDNVRSSDVAGRWGGDEFMLLLRGAEGLIARHVVERIRGAVRAVKLPDGSQFTLSVGIAVARPGDTQAAIFKRADEALYEAKIVMGKNAVAIK